jgi:hypothetical protein
MCGALAFPGVVGISPRVDAPVSWFAALVTGHLDARPAPASHTGGGADDARRKADELRRRAGE